MKQFTPKQYKTTLLLVEQAAIKAGITTNKMSTPPPKPPTSHMAVCHLS
jgi:hypothetical protein